MRAGRLPDRCVRARPVLPGSAGVRRVRTAIGPVADWCQRCHRGQELLHRAGDGNAGCGSGRPMPGLRRRCSKSSGRVELRSQRRGVGRCGLPALCRCGFGGDGRCELWGGWCGVARAGLSGLCRCGFRSDGRCELWGGWRGVVRPRLTGLRWRGFGGDGRCELWGGWRGVVRPRLTGFRWRGAGGDGRLPWHRSKVGGRVPMTWRPLSGLRGRRWPGLNRGRFLTAGRQVVHAWVGQRAGRRPARRARPVAGVDSVHVRPLAGKSLGKRP